MTESNTAFGAALARTRKEKGLSQEELAGRIGVSRQAVSKWETGEAAPALTRLVAAAEALEVSLDALCGREHAPAAVDPAAPADPATAVAVKRLKYLVWALALAVALLTGALMWSLARPDSTVAAETVPLPQDFTVSGLSFTPLDGESVAYQFTPSAAAPGYTYTISFAAEGESYPFAATCDGGVCAGTAQLPPCLGYTVTVSVSNGVESRALAVAQGFSFNDGSARWTPLDA